MKVNNGVQPPVTYSSGWNGHPSGFDSQFNGLSHQGYTPISEPPLNQNRDETNVPFIKPLELPDSKEDAQSKLLNGLSLSQGETRTITSNEQESDEIISDKNDDSRMPLTILNQLVLLLRNMSIYHKLHLSTHFPHVNDSSNWTWCTSRGSITNDAIQLPTTTTSTKSS